MDIKCYACRVDLKMILKDGDFRPDECWAICWECGLIVCSGHGRRDENPWKYKCAYCTGDSIEKWRPYHDPNPHPSSPPPDDLELLTHAISDLRVEIIEAVKDAVIKYQKDRGKSEHSALDAAALAVAAKAYRKTVGILEKVTVRDMVH